MQRGSDKQWLSVIVLLLIVLASSFHATAQERSREKMPSGSDSHPGSFGMPGMTSDGRGVKGRPFSAEAIIEHIQTFSDGNRVTQKSTVVIYRDSEGRLRREMTLGAIGPWSVAGAPPPAIFIFDVVAGVSFNLDPRRRIAWKRPLPPTSPEENALEQSPFRMLPSWSSFSESSSESLGDQIISDIKATGTRSTRTIRAGAVGNERAFEIVYERWFSEELQTIVMSRHYDPRFGENIYRLTKVTRGEPPRSLFEVPADYTVSEDSPFRRSRTKRSDRR